MTYIVKSPVMIYLMKSPVSDDIYLVKNPVIYLVKSTVMIYLVKIQ